MTVGAGGAGQAVVALEADEDRAAERRAAG